MLFGIVWVLLSQLSQHGVGEVLIPLRHCWRDAFSVFGLHCSVLFWSLDALFVFVLPPLRPPRLLPRQLLRVGLCMSPGVPCHPVKE